VATIKKKLEIAVDIDNPVEEIKECIIAISIFNGPQQLDVLKKVEIWLGETIIEAERLNKEIAEKENEASAK
jgi:hypothetical protein